MARVGLLGGTFNPPHLGHLVCAQEAWLQLGLDRVLLVPVHTPPHKEIDTDPGVEQRVALCRLAVVGDERLGVSRADADVPGRSYTVDTLSRLHEAFPGDELTFIVGGDMARSLPTWREPEAVVALAWFGVAEREGAARGEILQSLSGIPGAVERTRFFAMPRIDISSTLIRRRVEEGRPVRYLVPEAVADHIAREGLYGGPRAPGPAAGATGRGEVPA